MPLLEFPLEVQEQIFNRCERKDLRNLVCCSTSYHNSFCINTILWQHVAISNDPLQETDFTKNRFNLSLMSRYTRVLRLRNTWKLNHSWKEKTGPCKRNADMNFKVILENCNATSLFLIHAPTRAYKCLEGMKCLTQLSLDGVRHLFDDDVKSICRNLSALRVLSVDNSNVNERTMLRSRNFKLSYDFLTEQAFVEMYRLMELEELNLTHCPIGELFVCRDSKLKRVKLEYCDRLKGLFNVIGDEGEEIESDVQQQQKQYEQQQQPALRHLRHLSVHCCHSLSDSAVRQCAHLFRPLTELKLQNLLISDAVVEDICPYLDNIDDLDVGVCSRLTDTSLRAISRLTRLRKLNIQCTERCSEPRYTNEGVLSLLNLHNLEVFNCEGLMKDPGWVTSDLYGHFYRFKNLSELFAGFARFEDDDLRYIARITSLQRLNLQASCCNVSNDGLFNLAPLKGLRKLVLDFVKNVTPEGIDRLKSCLPNLEEIVYRDATWRPRMMHA